MLVVATGALCSCAGFPGVRSEMCVTWVSFDPPQAAFDEATAVVIGEPAATGTTVEMFGVAATVHEVAVGEVLKGEIPDAGTIRVASTPMTCTGGSVYPDGDPLDVEGEVIVFLHGPEDGVWHTLTPFDGVLPLPGDGTLPFEAEAEPPAP